MSLLVHTYRRRADGRRTLLDDPPCGRDLGGPERRRTTVWGSEAAQASGARFLPRRASEDLYIEGDDVADFVAECVRLRAGSESFVSALRQPAGPELLHHVRSKLDNFVAAGRRALETEGGSVLIR
ncbi:hypothetical protein OG432_25450 [Streptomyces sp. NBC_00442]|uniref:hypothetical protein n=1 Tax=Streptomyces sp. NBC_00442 TaxID=2903651 RepID=UPI002E1D1BC5